MPRLRAQALQQSEATVLVTKAPHALSRSTSTKSDYVIDLTRRDGHVAKRFRPGQGRRPVRSCDVYSVLTGSLFLRNAAAGPTISIHTYDDQLRAARKRREQPDFPRGFSAEPDGGEIVGALEQSRRPSRVLRPG
jgi:hypothetical protein